MDDKDPRVVDPNKKFEDFRAHWPPIDLMATVAKEFVYDRDKYVKNLIDVGRILDAHGVKYLLAFGTLLGAIRDGGPCEGDQDVDLMVMEDQESKLVHMWLENQFLEECFCSNGFRICRVSNHMITVDRDNSYVDVYIFRPKPDGSSPGLRWCCNYSIDDWRIINPWTMDLHCRRWNIPAQPESYLERVYGHWKIPQNRHATT